MKLKNEDIFIPKNRNEDKINFYIHKVKDKNESNFILSLLLFYPYF